MTKYLLDTNDKRDVVMMYGITAEQDIAYRPIFEAARKQFAMRTTYVLSSGVANSQPYTCNGRINEQLIVQTIPDYKERTFYISGTHHMVTDVRTALHGIGVPRRHIKTDFFPGYA